MDIDQLLKSKSSKEKMDFLNSMRCKVTTKLKTTDEYKISEVVLLVIEFFNSTFEDKQTKPFKFVKSIVLFLLKDYSIYLSIQSA